MSERKISTSQDQAETPLQIFVGGIPSNLSHDELKEYFEQYGKVVNCKIVTRKKSSESLGYAFISFDSEEVQNTVTSLKHTIGGR